MAFAHYPLFDSATFMTLSVTVASSYLSKSRGRIWCPYNRLVAAASSTLSEMTCVSRRSSRSWTTVVPLFVLPDAAAKTPSVIVGAAGRSGRRFVITGRPRAAVFLKIASSSVRQLCQRSSNTLKVRLHWCRIERSRKSSTILLSGSTTRSPGHRGLVETQPHLRIPLPPPTRAVTMCARSACSAAHGRPPSLASHQAGLGVSPANPVICPAQREKPQCTLPSRLRGYLRHAASRHLWQPMGAQKAHVCVRLCGRDGVLGALKGDGMFVARR
jgi:hypothetical protein